VSANNAIWVVVYEIASVLATCAPEMYVKIRCG
jgi:hypothetical protein